MRIRYTVPLKRKIIVDDHWEVPMQGGKLRVIEKDGYAKAIEVLFERQPLEYAPQLQQHGGGKVVATITARDQRMIFVKRQLDDAASFLECFHDIELITDEIHAKYEGETPEEEAQIAIKWASKGPQSIALPLPFDMLTRAVMAADRSDGPRLEATLAGSARKALENQQFVDSFRYSFLLIEYLYGDGQFKKEALKEALKANESFRDIVDFAIGDVIPAKDDRSSDTAELLAAKPTVNDVIDHLVEKRGFYFHGNVKRKDAWKPHEQGSAETLALLSIGIVLKISAKAAGLMFAPELEKRYFEDAIRAGAIVVFEIKFKFRDLEEEFDHENQVNIEMPGTKVTPRSAFAVAQRFLQLFQEKQPTSVLRKVECSVQGTGQKVFDLTFHATEHGADSAGLETPD